MMEYKLEDVFDLQMGKTPSRDRADYWNTNDFKWISIADLTKSDKFISETKEYLSDVAVKESGISLIPSGTVIMSFKLSIGKAAITTEPMYSNEAIMAFKDKHVIQLLPDYVYYMLTGKNWDECANKAVKGKTLNKATLSKIKVNIHDLPKQREIVAVLDKTKSLIDKRNRELKQLDNLIKARFVEMFGDPMVNNKGFELKTYGDLFELNAGGTPSKTKSEYWDGGTISWIGSNMCQDTYIYENDGNYITEEGLAHSSARIFPIDTVLVALVGATIGKTALLKFETATNQNVLGIRKIRENGYLPEFVFYYTQGLYKRFLNIGDGGFAMASKGFISKLPIPVVSISSQEEFSSFAKQIDKSKFYK